MALADAASATSCFPPLATSCFLLGLPSDAPDDATRLPDRPSLSPELSPSSVSLSLSCRAQPSPPTLFAAATGPPSLPRSAQEILLDHLFLLAEKRTAGAPATSPPPSSSTSGPPAIFVKFVGSGASPSSPRPPSQPL